jgi:hypothetical protein
MMYLNENYCGYDSDALGFPSIKGCQAIVYQTTQALYGFHDYKVSPGFSTQEEVDNLRFAQFALHVQNLNIAHGTNAVALYGVILRGEQYGEDTQGRDEWQATLLRVATRLGFQGSVFGVRLGKHVGPVDSVYVRFDRKPTYCKIRYKTMSKMGSDTSSPLQVQPDALQLIERDMKDKTLINPPFKLSNPRLAVYPVKRKKGSGGKLEPDEGKLRTVGDSSIQRFR